MEWNLSALNPQMITVFMQLVRTKPEDRDEKALKAATERAAKLWGILDKHLAKRPYVAGDRLTMGDIPLGVLVFRWFTLVKDGPSLPELATWYAQIGRASCRESVWQYVEISVVAGSLKKKTE